MILRDAVLAAALAMAGRPDVMVSAAISLTDALEAVARAYQAAGGETVRLNVASSNVLARQIVSGAPVDLFISADERQMDVAARAGAIDVSTRVNLLGNRLAIFTLPGREVQEPAALSGSVFRRIAIGDPAAVPAGVYARMLLEAMGLWRALQPKLVPVSSVRAAVAAVENGSVEAAIAYETDVSGMRTARAALVISGAAAPRIVYPAAIVSASPNRAGAERFLAYLIGPEATAIFRQYKFVPLAPRR